MLPNRISVTKTVQHAIYAQFRAHLTRLNIRKRISLYRSWKDTPKPDKSEVVIIAGGPSFTREIAEAIIENKKYLDVVAINFYCLNDHSQLLIPNYYVLSDPIHLKAIDNALIEKNMMLKSYIQASACRLCVPYGESWDEYAKPFIFFDDSENIFSKNVDPRLPRGYPSNTMFKAIALMLAMGYEKIYLTGFDYDYPRKIFLDKDNKLMLRDEHHYKAVDSYYGNIYDSVGHALHWWAQDYWHLKKLSSPRIVNVTDTSLVDAFQRMSQYAFIEHLKTCASLHV